MKINTVIHVAIVMLVSAVVVPSVDAGPPSPVSCGDLTKEIDKSAYDALYLLCHETDYTWFKNQTDKESLKGKVIMAGIKLSQGKLRDADGKLSDYESTLRSLMDAAKKKVDLDRAQNTLLPAVDASQMVIANLS